MLALRGGAAIIRTHDVAPTVDAIKIHCAVEGAR
jgi:dihydropteroate synthase